MIDRVRDWGNIFTGNTGFGIAQSMLALGQVDLVTSNLSHAHDGQSMGMRTFTFKTHADLLSVLGHRMNGDQYDGVFMSAAVSDYAPAGAFAITHRQINSDGTETWTVNNAQAGKVKSTHKEIAFLGSKTQKIVDQFRTAWKYKGTLIKFKLEVGLTDEELIAVGQKSRRESKADYLVANTLDMVSGEKAGAYLLSDAGSEWVKRGELSLRLSRIFSA